MFAGVVVGGSDTAHVNGETHDYHARRLGEEVKFWKLGYLLGAGIMTLIGLLFIAVFEYGPWVALGVLTMLALR